MANTLTIEGAARYIEPTVRAVATVDLTGRTSNVEESVDVTFFDKDDNEVTVVTRSKNTPNVTVRLTLSAYKRVSVQQAVSLADDAYLSLTSEVSPASVVIYGSSDILATIDTVSTQSLVLPAETGVTSQELSLYLPEGVTLKRGQSSTVTLTAVVKEKTGERTLEVPLTYTHLNEDLMIADGCGSDGLRSRNMGADPGGPGPRRQHVPQPDPRPAGAARAGDVGVAGGREPHSRAG